MPVVGYLNEIPTFTSAPPDLARFRRGMQDLGYVEGQNVRLEVRQGSLDDAPRLAAELVALGAAVIFVYPPQVVDLVAAGKMGTTPLVFALLDESQVGSGPIASLARPGGSVTGLMSRTRREWAKRLETLVEAVPAARRVAFLTDDRSDAGFHWEESQRAARTLGVRLDFAEVPRPGDFAAGFAAIAEGQFDAVLVPARPGFRQVGTTGATIVALAAQHRLPAMYAISEMVKDGGLIAWNANLDDLYGRAAVYVDKILKGAKPADLPIEAPTRIDIAINLTTAQALGLTFPPSILVQATEVIR